jgi:hypothetical protein
MHCLVEKLGWAGQETAYQQFVKQFQYIFGFKLPSMISNWLLLPLQIPPCTIAQPLPNPSNIIKHLLI